MSRGFAFAALASTSAALEARSPCAASRGGATSTLAKIEPLGKRAVGLQRLERRKDATVHEGVDVHRGCLPERGEMVRS